MFSFTRFDGWYICRLPVRIIRILLTRQQGSLINFNCFLPELLRRKLGSECPKIVRVYSAAIEMKDYPVPRGDLRSRRGMQDLNSDQELTVRISNAAQS